MLSQPAVLIDVAAVFAAFALSLAWADFASSHAKATPTRRA
jgi:hypothetical protein